jgi:alcohol dehydrogenase
MTLSSSLQVVKRLTDGGADYSFECVGDTGVVSTALQSCSDVISIHLFQF